MVEIIPYTEDDDDQSNWVPLSPLASKRTDAVAPIPSATITNDDSSAAASAPRNKIADPSTGSHVVEDDSDSACEDDSHRWQKLPRLPLRNDGESSMAPPPSYNLGTADLLAHLTSRLTAAPTSTSATDGMDDNASEGDEGIVWRGADELAEGGIDENMNYSRNNFDGRRASIEEEYEDLRFEPRGEVPNDTRRVRQSVGTSMPQKMRAARDVGREDNAPEGDEGIVWRGADELAEGDIDENTNYSRSNFDGQRASIEEEYEDLKFEPREEVRCVRQSVGTPMPQKMRMARAAGREKGQRPIQQEPVRRVPEPLPVGSAPRSEPRRTSASAVRSSLWSLSLCFLRHLCRRVRARLPYIARSGDSQHFLASLTLTIICALLGASLIGRGLSGMAVIVVRGSVQATASFCSWAADQVLADGVLWVSIYATVILSGAFVYIHSSASINGQGNEASAFGSLLCVPVSTLLPWGVAVSSSSMYKALIIVISLQTFISLLPQGSESHSSLVLKLAICSGALLVAAMNAVAVSAAANIFEQNAARSDLPALGDPPPQTANTDASFPSTKPGLRKCLLPLQRNLGPCHTISLLALGMMSLFIHIIRSIYARCAEEGIDCSLVLIDGIWAVGCNTVSVGLGVYLLVVLHNTNIAAFSANDALLSCRVLFAEMLRDALRDAVADVSGHACSSDGLRSIFSDDDGALRLAVLEWVIDRWAQAQIAKSDQRGTSSAVEDGEVEIYCNSASSDGGSFCNDNQNPQNNGREEGNDNSSVPNSSSFDGGNHAESSSELPSGPRKSASIASESILPSYRSLQNVVARLDADETLIPTIERYRAWVYSIPPTQRSAACAALWKMCPGTAALVLMVAWHLWLSTIGRLFSCGLWYLNMSRENTRSDEGNGVLLFIFTILVILSPLLFIEYQRVHHWWMTMARQLKDPELEGRLADERAQGDFAMLLLQANTDGVPPREKKAGVLTDSSFLLLTAWGVLLESIDVLESSVPVVRCATAACAAADLTYDTICLANFALEVKKRGILGGMGMILWDAFQYQLSQELRQRQQEAAIAANDPSVLGETETEEEENIDGPCTGSLVRAVGNFEKMSHNISCLMESKSEDGIRREHQR